MFRQTTVRYAVIFFIVTFVLVRVAIARGAFQDNPKLDSIATQLAGKPETVSCSSSWAEWSSWVGTALPGATAEDTEGFSQLQNPVLYLNPKICETLTVMTNYGYAEVGPYYAAEAVTVLVHESEHQALNSLDEALVECTALTKVDGVITGSFGVPSTITTVHYRVIRNHVVKTKTTSPNPWLTSFDRWVQMWHAVRSAAYHAGSCG